MPPNKRNIVEFFNDEYRWWESIYENHEERVFLSYEMCKRKEVVVEFVEKLLKHDENETVLDCGCGPGEILRVLKEKGVNVVGVDINENFVKSIGGEFKDISLAVRGDVERLPFNDGSFDIVICVGVLSYLQKDEEALAEIHRVLKKNGVAIITFPNLLPLYKLTDPYYFCCGVFKHFINKYKFSVKRKDNANIAYEEQMIRKYVYFEIMKKTSKCRLVKIESRGVSFGPFSIFRKNVFTPINSILLSEKIKKLSEKINLEIISSRWVIAFRKIY